MKKKIAVIGGGISGMASAYYASEFADVTLYEKRERLGGHARTKKFNGQSVDTGFIVFNYVNYPLLVDIFETLNVQVEKSNMSFAASFPDTNMEFGLSSLKSIFSQRRNILNVSFLKMLYEINKFNSYCRKAKIEKNWTLEQLLNFLRLSDGFFNYYFLPLSGAIWSATPEQMRLFPADNLVNFFRNHNLLTVSGQHQWYTVSGGSISYVDKMKAYLEQKGVNIILGADDIKVMSCPKDKPSILREAAGEAEQYDEVILATHSDDALRMLSNPTAAQKIGLNNIQYTPNKVVLHTDESVMPRNKINWSAWNYMGPCKSSSLTRIPLTYWMNKLQNIESDTNFFVSLNYDGISPESVINETVLRHPLYDFDTLAGQELLRECQGENDLYFAGAYMGYGFHEDGCRSAKNAVDKIKEKLSA